MLPLDELPPFVLGAATVGFGAATVGAAVVVGAGACDVVTGVAVAVLDVVLEAAGFLGFAFL